MTFCITARRMTEQCEPCYIWLTAPNRISIGDRLPWRVRVVNAYRWLAGDRTRLGTRVTQVSDRIVTFDGRLQWE